MPKKTANNRPSPPVKTKNLEKRSREYLTVAEVNALLKAASQTGRHGERDALLILMTFRHALRVGEVISLEWEQIDFKKRVIQIDRLKNGESSEHHLEADEIAALKKLRRDYPDSDFVFASERQGPLSSNAVYKIVARAGTDAKLKISVHPHMLRHGKGFQLAAQGVDTTLIQAYMGHKNIQHSAKYSRPAKRGLKGLGKDVSF